MKIADILEAKVVKFETPEQKEKRVKKEEQVKALKGIDHKGRQEQLKSMVRQGDAEERRSKFKAV